MNLRGFLVSRKYINNVELVSTPPLLQLLAPQTHTQKVKAFYMLCREVLGDGCKPEGDTQYKEVSCLIIASFGLTTQFTIKWSLELNKMIISEPWSTTPPYLAGKRFSNCAP